MAAEVISGHLNLESILWRSVLNTINLSRLYDLMTINTACIIGRITMRTKFYECSESIYIKGNTIYMGGKTARVKIREEIMQFPAIWKFNL